MERGKGDCKLCLEQIGRAQNRFNKHGQMKIWISDPPSSLSARLVVVNRSVSPTGRGPRDLGHRKHATAALRRSSKRLFGWWCVRVLQIRLRVVGWRGGGCSPHCLWDYANDTNRTGQPPHSSSHLSPLLRRLWSVSTPPSTPLSPRPPRVSLIRGRSYFYWFCSLVNNERPAPKEYGAGSRERSQHRAAVGHGISLSPYTVTLAVYSIEFKEEPKYQKALRATTVG